MKRRDNFWKQIPFLRILLPFCLGIISGFYFSFPYLVLTVPIIGVPVVFIVYNFLSRHRQYRLRYLPGTLVLFVFYCFGILSVTVENARNSPNWFGHNTGHTSSYLAVLEEPLVNKPRSYKAVSRISNTVHASKNIQTSGKLIIYFKKMQGVPLPGYGSQIAFLKNPEPVQRSGNPYAFDYARYCLFQGITHKVYLEEKDVYILPQKKENDVKRFIYNSKQHVLDIIRKFVPGKPEAGIAEALLIGYKDDLDKSLVTSYSNTGVVHIIAISGLHLGIIYWLLGLLLNPLKFSRRTKWLRPLLIMSSLWIFTLLAGAQPSILRSAVMFSCIVIGESLSRKTSIYNTMAVSAFILLCINPFWLWDAGFQLSYAAVLSIIIFMKPINNLYYSSNKLLDLCWKMNAVTISAQLLTIPICIYHFHQFPNLFLLTNFVAVPLSSLILLGEIGLCIVSGLPAIAFPLGEIISWLIRIMNDFIQRTEAIPFSSWKNLHISLEQTILLYLFISFSAASIMKKFTTGIYLAITALFFFAFIRHVSFKNAYAQRRIIIYNVPGKTAIDFINGRSCHFTGDPSVLADLASRSFHIDPARTAYRTIQKSSLNNLSHKNEAFDFNGYKMLLVSRPFQLDSAEKKQQIDLMIISGNPFYSLSEVKQCIDIKLIVFCGPASRKLRDGLKKECNVDGIPYHDVQEKGAFVKNLR